MKQIHPRINELEKMYNLLCYNMGNSKFSCKLKVIIFFRL